MAPKHDLFETSFIVALDHQDVVVVPPTMMSRSTFSIPVVGVDDVLSVDAGYADLRR